MALPLQQTPNTPICISFFDLPEALITQALLLPCAQDQAGERVSVTVTRGEAQVEV